MDRGRLVSLTRSLATAKTRRGLLGTLAALGAGLLGVRATGAQQVTQAQCGNKVCAANPGVCTGGCVCCVYGNGNSRCRPPQECSGTVVSSTTTPAPTTTTTMTAEPTCLNQGLGVCLPGQNTCLANGSCAKSCTFGGCPAGCGCVPAAEGGGYCRAAEVCLPTDQVCTGTADCPRGMLCQATVCSAGGPTERRCKLLCPTA